MTLLEMLADGLDLWPYDELIYATQDSDGEIWFSEALPSAVDDGSGIYWTSPGLRVCSSPYYHYDGVTADDHSFTVITMRQWEEEHRRLQKQYQEGTANSCNNELLPISQPEPTSDTIRPHAPPPFLTARDYLYSVHLDWTRNYVGIEQYATNNGIAIIDAMVLIALASSVAKLNQPAE